MPKTHILRAENDLGLFGDSAYWAEITVFMVTYDLKKTGLRNSA